jgi:hypothetical protein
MSAETDRPTIDPSVVGALTEAAPARLIRKLDKDPERAEAWSWTESDGVWTIETGGDAVVTLSPADGAIAVADQVSCTCLLAPKCLHLLSVLTRLEIGDAAIAPAETGDDGPAEIPEIAELDDAQIAAARRLRAVLVDQVDAGLGSCGVIGQGSLLRAVHACRLAGLPRLGTTGVRIVEAVRALQSRAQTFSTPGLGRDVAEALEITERLAAGRVHRGDVGVARQRYEPIGNLRAVGLLSEPIATSSGYAGVVTYLVAPDGRLLSVSDVRPGDATRARQSYRNGVEVGDASISHRELCRAGLFLTRATASASGRLGRGKDVGAVAGPGCAWGEPPIADLFARPIADQVASALEALELPVDQRPAGYDLLMFEAEIVDLGGAVIRFELDDGRAIDGRVSSENRALRFRENLRVLGRARGRAKVIARLSAGELDTVAPLALSPLDDSIALPDSLGGVINIGMDRLSGASVSKVDDSGDDAIEDSRDEPDRPEGLVDPCAALRRRLHRVVLGGRNTVPASAGPEIDRERARLARQMLELGAALLGQLWLAARRGPADGGGVSAADSADALARAYARAHAYDRALTRRLIEASWR